MDRSHIPTAMVFQSRRAWAEHMLANTHVDDIQCYIPDWQNLRNALRISNVLPKGQGPAGVRKVQQLAAPAYAQGEEDHNRHDEDQEE